jgi:hypothetical protein
METILFFLKYKHNTVARAWIQDTFCASSVHAIITLKSNTVRAFKEPRDELKNEPRPLIKRQTHADISHQRTCLSTTVASAVKTHCKVVVKARKDC